jgi:hypothetical protein
LAFVNDFFHSFLTVLQESAGAGVPRKKQRLLRVNPAGTKNCTAKGAMSMKEKRGTEGNRR